MRFRILLPCLIVGAALVVMSVKPWVVFMVAIVAAAFGVVPVWFAQKPRTEKLRARQPVADSDNYSEPDLVDLSQALAAAKADAREKSR